MFALSRLIPFPLILGQVGLNLAKPTLNLLKTVNKTGISQWDRLCTAYDHKVQRGYSSITLENNTGVQEIKVEENEEKTINKGALGKIQPKLKLIYTCKVCETRNTKYFSRLAYEKGIVIVICDGCDSKHLIADNLQWFNDNGTNVEKILSQRGESVKRGKVLVDEKGQEFNVVQNCTGTA